MRSQGEVKIIYDRSNTPKEGGGFQKNGNVMVLWDACAARNEDQTASAASIPKKSISMCKAVGDYIFLCN